MTEQTTAEPCTNYYVTRRHYSTDMAAGIGGRRGTSLCRPGGRATDVYDQEWVTREDQRWRPSKPHRLIVDLPGCTPCARALTKMEAGRG